MDITAGLSAASQAISIARTLRDIEKSYDAVNLKSQIVDLMDKLQEVRGSLQDARDALELKDRELTSIREAMKTKVQTVVHLGYRYTADPLNPEKPVGTPFCRRCEQVEQKMILCIHAEKGGLNAQCPQCKTIYRDATMWFWPGER